MTEFWYKLAVRTRRSSLASSSAVNREL